MSNDPVELLLARSQKELYNKLLAIEIMEVKPGYAKTTMEVKPEMSNIFGMLHGGAVFSLMDEAFQYACNSHGKVAVALELSIYYLAPARMGRRLFAEVSEINRTPKTALYEAKVYEEDGRMISKAQALAYRKNMDLPFDADGELLDSQ